MRDLFVFAVVILMLPSSIRKPFVGLLVFSWLAYMRPQDLCWGFARTMRLSFFVGIAMVAGWWAYEQGKRRFCRWDARTVAMCVLGLLVTISYAFAFKHDEYTNTYYIEYLKIILVALFTTGQVDSRERLRLILWTIALSLGFYGVKNGLLGIARGGGQILRGPGGMLEDNNDLGLALVMNVPLLWYLGISEGKQWVVRATQAAVVLTVVTILLTHSRGAFLALCMTALWIAWRSGHLFRAAFGLTFCAVLFFAFAPASVLERIASIGEGAAGRESSANARFTAWATALRMIGDNPMLGVGMRNFQSSFRDYSLVQGSTYVAHNSYLQIWAESGSLAFAVYLLLLASVFFACRRVLRMARGRPDLQWAHHYGRMMEATTVGFLVGAFFLNRGAFDLIYHWLALVTALLAVTTVAWRAAPAGAVAAAGAGAGPRAVEVRWRRPFGAARPLGGNGALATPRWR
jgi:putative inorganic carbon (HCO3(-)) transporter